LKSNIQYIVGVILAQQYSLKKGLELFGDRADASVTKELTQIHDLGTYEPIDLKTMSYEDRKRALASLLFVTEKRNGDIKVRKVADGSKQRSYNGYNKSDGSSPTVATDNIFVTGLVDAREGRSVAILDIANAFLHADNDEKILMLLRGKLAEIMVKIDPLLYRKYVTFSSKGVPILYVRLSKALYGMLRAALLFYKRLRSDLGDVGFEVNLYDPYVANNMVNGKYMTVCWHVGDLKVSHMEESAVSSLALKLAKLYGPNTMISCGRVHDYLGMEMDFGTDPGTMIISMIKYLQKIIEEFPEALRGTKSSPARDNLFEIREEGDRKLLPEEQARPFHRTVAQLLFLCMRERPHLQTLVSFLTTRVMEPDKDNWRKLRHGLMYLKGNLHMKRYMGADSLCIIK
jgi:hypothetical protein